MDTSGVVENDSGKVIEAERGLQVRSGLDVVSVGPVSLVQLGQHRLIRPLKQTNINQMLW